MFLNFIIGLIVNIIILLYVLKLENENCECSNNWKRDTIKYLSGFIIIFSSLISISRLFNITNISPLIILILIIYGACYIVYLSIISLYYVDLTVDKSCVCSKDLSRYALIYPLFTLCFGLLIGVINLMSMPKKMFTLKKKK